jgi:membrane fusion protein, multidrug efflux system
MSDQPMKKDEEPRKLVWPWALVGLVVVAFMGIVFWLIFAPKHDVKTDDARVAVHYTVVAPRVSAPIVAVKVVDNQNVRAGDLLAVLDPTDFETAVANARATLARDQAQVSDMSASIERQPSVIAQTQASVPSSQARLDLAAANQERYQNLATTGAGTYQAREQAESTYKQAKADLDAAQQALTASQHELEILKARRAAAEAQVEADRTAVKQAQINLSYTQIRAPLEGTVGQLSIQVGNYVTPGSPLMSIVPLEQIFIEANYLEVDLKNVRPGQPVRIHVDAYGTDLNGTVDSLAPASGATYSAIPSENATGNFTKIVQRLTVKIAVDPNQPNAKALRVGLNVETTILTDAKGTGPTPNAAMLTTGQSK